MGTEQERIKKIIEDMAQGKNIGDKLYYDVDEKKLKPKSQDSKSSRYIKINPSDADLYGSKSEDVRIVISGEIIETLKPSEAIYHYFNCWDEGTVFSLINDTLWYENAPGTIYYNVKPDKISISEIGKPGDVVRVIISKNREATRQSPFSKSFTATGYTRYHGDWQRAPVQIVPIKDEIFSRFSGLIETDILSNKTVLIIGQGSGGSYATIELAKAGVNFFLVDHQRLEVANPSRHAAGLSQVGRYKTKIMADLIHDRNPYASVETLEIKVTWDNMDQIREIVGKVDLVLAATDNKESKRIINRLCVEENKPCIFAGASRRAYMGQILFLREPYQSPCYQCFLSVMPEQADDVEISDQEQAQELSYTDRPVAIEPGLSNDITPISLMTVKLAIQHLLKDKQTTLQSLDDDLVAPWFVWINRRESNTPYESLEPLEFHVDGMHILRWYGIDLKPNKACPVCGNFEHASSEQSVIRLPLSTYTPIT